MSAGVNNKKASACAHLVAKTTDKLYMFLFCGTALVCLPMFPGPMAVELACQHNVGSSQWVTSWFACIVYAAAVPTPGSVQCAHI
jgi:hypothetical protein